MLAVPEARASDDGFRRGGSLRTTVARGGDLGLVSNCPLSCLYEIKLLFQRPFTTLTFT